MHMQSHKHTHIAQKRTLSGTMSTPRSKSARNVETSPDLAASSKSASSSHCFWNAFWYMKDIMKIDTWSQVGPSVNDWPKSRHNSCNEEFVLEQYDINSNKQKFSWMQENASPIFIRKTVKPVIPHKHQCWAACEALLEFFSLDWHWQFHWQRVGPMRWTAFESINTLENLWNVASVECGGWDGELLGAENVTWSSKNSSHFWILAISGASLSKNPNADRGNLKKYVRPPSLVVCFIR